MGAEYKAADVAAFIVDRGICEKRPVSNLQLQKMLYFAQCDYMKEHGGDVLFDDAFEAWQYGPVVPSVYNIYSIFGGAPITKASKFRNFNIFGLSAECVKDLGRDVAECVKKTIAKWINNPAWELVEESHKAGGAWDLVYNENGIEASGYRNEIPTELIYETAV